MSAETFYPIWLGPNDGLGVGVKDTEGPHNLPTQTMVHRHLEPSGKTHDEKGGHPSDIYEYRQWLELCPEELVFRSVASVLGDEHVAFAAKHPGSPQALIASKLVAVASELVTVDKRAKLPIIPTPERVEELLCEALSSGDPIMHLDAQLGPKDAPEAL